MLFDYAFCSATQRFFAYLMNKALMEPRGIVTMTNVNDVSFIRSVPFFKLKFS